MQKMATVTIIGSGMMGSALAEKMVHNLFIVA